MHCVHCYCTIAQHRFIMTKESTRNPLKAGSSFYLDICVMYIPGSIAVLHEVLQLMASLVLWYTRTHWGRYVLHLVWITQASSSHACGSHNTGRVETCQALIGQAVIHQLTWHEIRKNKRYFHSKPCPGFDNLTYGGGEKICDIVRQERPRLSFDIWVFEELNGAQWKGHRQVRRFERISYRVWRRLSSGNVKAKCIRFLLKNFRCIVQWDGNVQVSVWKKHIWINMRLWKCAFYSTVTLIHMYIFTVYTKNIYIYIFILCNLLGLWAWRLCHYFTVQYGVCAQSVHSTGSLSNCTYCTQKGTTSQFHSTRAEHIFTRLFLSDSKCRLNPSGITQKLFKSTMWGFENAAFLGRARPNAAVTMLVPKQKCGTSSSPKIFGVRQQ